MKRLQEFAKARKTPLVVRALGIAKMNIPRNESEFRGVTRKTEILDGPDLERFPQVWKEHLFEHHYQLSAQDEQLFLEAFGQELRPKSVKHFITETDRILFRHLQSEFSLLESLRGNLQLLVQGGPGTGKTWLAVEQAYRLAESGGEGDGAEGESQGARVLLLCYNLALSEALAAMVNKRKPRKGEVVVRSWETLAQELFKEFGIPWTPPNTYQELLAYYSQEVPGLMLEIVKDPTFTPRFDALVVDEAQDHDTLTFQGTAMSPAGVGSELGSGSETGSAGSESSGDTVLTRSEMEEETGWWEIYFRLLRKGTAAPMAMFFDPEQRPLFRDPAGFDPDRLRARLSQAAHVYLPFAKRYSRPVFEFLKSLDSETTRRIAGGMRAEGFLPEGPEVEQHVVKANQVPAKVREIVMRWIQNGYCLTDEILILAPHRKSKSSLANCKEIGAWPLFEGPHRLPGKICFNTVNKAKGLDSLAVILVDVEPFEKMAEGQDKLNYFMGASRARQLLAVLHTPREA